MSDLEQQASAWVPPWQRPGVPVAQPPADSSPGDSPSTVDDAAPGDAEVGHAAAADGTLSDAARDAAAADGTPRDGTLRQDEAADGARRGAAGGDEASRDAEVAEGAARDAAVDGAPAGIAAHQDAADVTGGDAQSTGAVPSAQAARQAAADEQGAAVTVIAPKGKRERKEEREQAALPEQRAPEPEQRDAAPLLELGEAELVAALEAILMVVDEPVTEITLASVLEVPAEHVANALIDMSSGYTRDGRGFDLRRAAGGWRFYTRADYSPYVERFVLDGQQLRLTQASLETLAVVAYKQPVTRSRISAIRGVNCDGVIRTLITRGMVEECGTDPDSGAHLYRTTTLFLEKMGLDTVEQLPALAPFLPDNLEELAAGE